MATAISKRVAKLEQGVSGEEPPYEIIVLNVGDPDPILDDTKNWIVVRAVAPQTLA